MNKVAGTAFNYDFKLFMEGIEVPFKSANVVCTPNGVEFNINVHVNKELLDLKPKTAVQIFYREWHTAARAWRLMADGFISGYVTGEDSQGGRAIGITCRDFRMDIRKSPSAMAYNPTGKLNTRNLFSVHGIYQNIARKSLVAGRDSGEDTVIKDGVRTRVYSTDGLLDLAFAMEQIVGTAYGKKVTSKDGGRYAAFNFSTSEIEDDKGNKKANGGLFLDAFIRGIWMEAVGGTRVNSFLNKRLRCDKRFLVLRNYAGFNFWKRQSFGLEVGTAIMGNAQFSSLEAAMMNAAGMFSCRVYSCSTPSLISLKKENNPGLEYVMDEGVRKFLEANKKEFGAMYTLNQSMLLPPFEFTAPPNCNLFFPPMYDRLNWRRDDDSDITRAYFGVIHSLVAKAGVDWGNVKFQIPNDMFLVTDEETKKKTIPLTLEERYKGVSVYHGSVEYNLAAADAAKTAATAPLTEKGKKKLEEGQNKIEEEEDAASVAYESYESLDPNSPVAQEMKARMDAAKKKKAADSASQKAKNDYGGNTAAAYKRHAMIKYVNLKYQGRVVTVDMNFNPYVMAGFPGAVISAQEEMNTNVSKTMIGMVQQVSHAIHITPQGGEAATTVIMNNVRFEDEPTDMSSDGMPLYVYATNSDDAEVDIEKLEFVDSEYLVPDARQILKKDKESKKFDLKDFVPVPDGALYVKDFLSTSTGDLKTGKDENIYIDRSYEPNRIFKFYETVFGHRTHHFMLGSAGNKWFAYNSMHEAFQELKGKRPDLLYDYEACMRYVERNVCSADAFYHGILGMSSRGTVFSRGEGKEIPGYVNRESSFLNSVIELEYFGVNTDAWEEGDAFGLDMDGPGEFSSIRESSPITAFIKERRESVESYKKAVMKTATGVVFDG